MNKISRKAYAVVAIVVGAVAFGTPVFAVDAVPYDASAAAAAATNFVGQLTGGLVPVMVAIAGGIVGIAVLGWGLRVVFSKVRSAAHF
jgi:hypothetical protein